MATRTYRLKIVREGQELEAEGDKAFVLDMVKRFAPNRPSDTRPEAAVHVGRRGSKGDITSPIKSKALSIREFVQQLGLKKHTDITLAFGYYLEKFSDIQEFTPADINNCYYEAKLEASNTSQMIIQNIKRGRLMPSKKRGERGKNRYTVTASGEAFIESKLPRNG